MTVVRYKNRQNGEPAFNNLLSDFFTQMPSLYRDDFKQGVPVNVRENETGYLLDFVAPGWTKEDFAISLEKNILTVSAQKKEEAANEKEKFLRREHQVAAFKRSFTVDEKMNADGVSAQYVNGVLTVSIPKKEEVKPVAKQITIQ